MEKYFLSRLLFFSLLIQTAFAQSDVVRVMNVEYKVTDLKVLDQTVTFTTIRNKVQREFQKAEVTSITFKNGFQLQYQRTAARQMITNYYNATINLNNGDFFTAFVFNIDSTNLFYYKYQGASSEKISVNEILFIVYKNGIRENFITSNSKKVITEKKSNPDSAAIENRKFTASHFGILTGLNKAWINEGENYFLTRQPRKCFTAGISFDKAFSSEGGIQLGLMFEQKGVIYRNDTLEFELKTSYLTIPFNYQLYLGNKSFNGFLDGGFFAGFLLTATTTSNNLNSGTSKEYDLLSDGTNPTRLDFGLQAGGGIKYKYKVNQFTLGMRYSFSLFTLSGSTYNYYPNYVYYGTASRSIVFYVSYGVDLRSRKQQKKSVQWFK